MAESLAAAVTSGGRLAGTVLTLPGATAAELLAEPFDLVWVDLEHGALGPLDAQEMIIGAQAAGTYALVRLPADAHGLMTAMLDAGADGVVLADVAHPRDGLAAIERVAHPPDGTRGWGPRRLTLRQRGTGRRPPRPSVWVQIESAEGVAHVEQIASVPGIDAVVVGTADLSFSLGAPLDTRAPELLHAVETVRRAAALGGRRARRRRRPRGDGAGGLRRRLDPRALHRRAPVRGRRGRRRGVAARRPRIRPRSRHLMTEYLKHAPLYAAQAGADVRRTVSEMLSAHPARRGRRDPPLLAPSSTAGTRRRSSSTRPTIAARRRPARRRAARPHRLRPGAGARLRHGPARRRMRDLEVETLPGVDARPPPHPGAHRRRLRPRRALPDARLVVHDRRSSRRSPASST